jgi:hypothetical protein
VLTVTGNQPTLERELAALFPAEPALPPHHGTFDRGHGRTEIREITTTSHVADIDFPGVFQAVRIRRETCDLYDNQIRRPETVYGITSRTAQQANPADLLAHNRGHWQIENREHYVRDRTYDEDRSHPVPQRVVPSVQAAIGPPPPEVQNTACHGGYSLGSSRQAQPVRTT